MWTVYFGEWTDGRLKRLQYFGYYVLLMFLVMLMVVGSLLLVGMTPETMQRGMDAMATLFVDRLGWVVILSIFVVMIIIFAAQLNIMAKRIRDMGLPAWWTILALIIVSILLNLLFPTQQIEVASTVVGGTEVATHAAFSANASTGSIVTELYNLVVFLCLVFIPSDFFKKSVV
jgi:uncharacterized membrane protein YhaH (DUF805 family)